MTTDRQCSKCMGLWSPETTNNSAFCPYCVQEMNASLKDAIDYRRKIDSGDINVTPQNDDDARTVRRHIAQRITSEPDSQPLRKRR